MSNIYVLEPPTKGKIVISTDCGDIEIELWPKETPKTCRNFVQLSLEGYYNKTIFHRIVKDFCIQAGDRTGTGEHQETVTGTNIPDEFHSRLRFSRRGLIASANIDPGKNGSQFFITLDKAEELNNKHTIFGKVVGETFYNVVRISEREVDAVDRPIYPPKIVSIRIIENPFEDIIPRFVYEQREAQSQRKLQREPPSTARDVKLLSFMDDDNGENDSVSENEEEKETRNESFKRKIMSIHDVVRDDKRLCSEVAIQIKQTAEPANTREYVKLGASESPVVDSNKRADKNDVTTGKESLGEIRTNKAISIERTEKKTPVSSLISEQRARFGYKKAAKGEVRERETLRLLALFENKLDGAQSNSNTTSQSIRTCSLHGLESCLSCIDTFGQEDTQTDSGWLTHRLKFAPTVRDAMARNDNVDDLVVIDPRIQEVKDQFKKREKREREYETRDNRLTNNKKDQLEFMAIRENDESTSTDKMNEPVVASEIRQRAMDTSKHSKNDLDIHHHHRYRRNQREESTESVRKDNIKRGDVGNEKARDTSPSRNKERSRRRNKDDVEESDSSHRPSSDGQSRSNSKGHSFYY